MATRINHFEALNKELSERAEHLEAERTTYKETILAEQQTIINEMQGQLTRAEQDLTRVRAARDELIQDQTQRKIREDQKQTSVKEVGELAETRAFRIASLEMEVDRLKSELSTETLPVQPPIAEWGLEELQQKFEQLDKAYEVLKQELPSLENAFRGAHDQATRKVTNIQETEEKMRRLQAEVGFSGSDSIF